MPEVNPEPIPDELKDRDQWLLYDTRADRPRQPHWGGDFGISWSDPDDWHSFEDAVELAEQREEWGIGYVTAAENDAYARGLYGVIDLDGCADGEHGEPKEWVPDLQPLLGEDGAYVEWSPSGTGLHVPVVGIDVPDWWTDQHFSDDEHEGIEVLTNKFVTFTGDTEIDAPVLEYGEDAEEWLADAYEAVTGETAPPRRTGNDSGGGRTSGGSADGDLSREDIEEALSHVDPDVGYPTWRNIGFGLQDHFDRDRVALDVFTEWSRGGAKWDREAERQAERIIDEAEPGRGCTIATVIHHALEGGWSGTHGSGNPPTAAELIARYSDEYDDPDEVPDDIIERTKGERDDLTDGRPDGDGRVTAAADGGATTATTGAAGGPLPKPSTEHVKTLLRVDEADGETLDDYNDRKKAAAVWQSVRQSDEMHIRVREDNQTLWAYDNGVWTRTGEQRLQEAAREAVGPMHFGANLVSELEAQARADPTVKVEPDEFGLDAGEIAVENGVVDLRAAADGAGTSACRRLEPEDYALTKLPVKYDPGAESEHFAPFVAEVVEDGMVDAVQEYVGYCLHRDELPFAKAMMCVGTGANGKSTFLSVIQELLGEDVSTTPLHKFDEDNHVAELYGKLANIQGDLSSAALNGRAVGMFKQLTGGDTVTGRHLYEDAFSFRPAAKHIYAANTTPDVSKIVEDHDTAWWRRWILVHFPNYYPPGSDARDPDLEAKITGRRGYDGELSAVLNWAIEGWGRLLENGEFTGVEKNPDDVRREWQRWGESADEFVVECLESDPDATNVTTGEAYAVYREWCQREGKDATGQQSFTTTLKSCDVDVGYGKSVRTDRHSPTNGYKKFGLTDAAPALDEVLEEDIDQSQAQLGGKRDTGGGSEEGTVDEAVAAIATEILPETNDQMDRAALLEELEARGFSESRAKGALAKAKNQGTVQSEGGGVVRRV